MTIIAKVFLKENLRSSSNERMIVFSPFYNANDSSLQRYS